VANKFLSILASKETQGWAALLIVFSPVIVLAILGCLKWSSHRRARAQWGAMKFLAGLGSIVLFLLMLPFCLFVAGVLSGR
jgi:hypothetical protein